METARGRTLSAYKVAMLNRDRLIRMRVEKERFIDNLKSARRSMLNENFAEFESMYII
jgi:hypothetical protein